MRSASRSRTRSRSSATWSAVVWQSQERRSLTAAAHRPAGRPDQATRRSSSDRAKRSLSVLPREVLAVLAEPAQVADALAAGQRLGLVLERRPVADGDQVRLGPVDVAPEVADLAVVQRADPGAARGRDRGQEQRY